MSRPKQIFGLLLGIVLATSAFFVLAETFGFCVYPVCKTPQWSQEQMRIIRSLSLSSLPAPPDDPSNVVADDPRAAELGHRLFFDPRLSATAEISCAHCHQPNRYFTDGLAKARALGESKRNTPTIVGSAYSPWLYWDGRKDSLWSQALAPLEDPAEHGGNRLQYARLITSDTHYRAAYEELFGPLPEPSLSADRAKRRPRKTERVVIAPHDQKQVDRIFVNMGKAIAAYERLLVPGPARFDRYVEGLDGQKKKSTEHLTAAEIRGLGLFIGKARCIDCHNGPLFTNNEFHNTGVISFPAELPDRGRSEGLFLVEGDEFNCMGGYSDLPSEQCLELRFVRRDEELLGAFRTPSLRNVTETAPYMHKGQLKTLGEVLRHYKDAPPALIGHNEAEPLNLSPRELQDLEAFLHALSAPPATKSKWLKPPLDQAAPTLPHSAQDPS